ncbi:hypothetical protein [Candidatus Pelagibacter sp. HIMB1746]|uniref:hypothetical protein n=1 Tax=Candidatus Pelagibacter sp. HIMB1746 TaxID=3413370 RepID=UPI003F84F86F
MKIIFLFFQTIKSLISDIRHSYESNKHFKTIEFEKYIKNNYAKWNELDEKIFGSELIAIDCTNFHPMNLIQNLILAKYLQKFYKKEILVIDKVKNKYRSSLYKSFNITNITYITNLNPINHYYKHLKLFFSLTKKIKDIDQFIDLKLDDIEIGKVSYDDYLRNSFEGTANNINYKLFFYLFKSICSYNEIQKILKIYKIKYYVTHEIQFNPEAIIFQLFLKNKIKIFCKGIGQTKIGLRLFKNFSQRRYNRASLSKNTYLKLLQSSKRDTFIKKGEEQILSRFKNKRNLNDIFDLTFAFNPEKKIVDKDYICKIFGWDNKIPIIVVFANNIFDGVFEKRISIFQDNYIWLQKTLKYLCENKKINILVKKHPTEYEITKLKDKTEIIVDNYKFKNNNLNIFPNEIHPSSILQFAKCVFTEHGTAGLEYSCFGIPAIVTGDAIYYRTGFAFEPKNIDEYKQLIYKIHELPKLNEDQIKKAKLFAFYDIELSRVETKLNSYINTTGNNINNEYWNNLSLNLKDFNFENCKFFKMLNTMLKNKNYNILNFDEL